MTDRLKLAAEALVKRFEYESMALHKTQREWLVREIASALRASAPPDAGVRLEACPVDGSQEWTEIFPAQLEWIAKQGHQVRAIETALAIPPDAGCREALEEQGLIHGTYPEPLEHYQRTALNLAAVWANGNDGARTCILAALLRAALPQGKQPEGTTCEQCDYADMLWKWFGSEERCGAEYMRHEMREGLSADDFKAMLDGHEAALISPSPSLHPPTVDVMRLADQLENHAENLTKTALNNRDTRFIKLLEKSANTLRALATNAKTPGSAEAVREALIELSKCDGSLKNVASAEILASRVRHIANNALSIEPEEVEPEELENLICDRSANRAADAILAEFVVTRRVVSAYDGGSK